MRLAQRFSAGNRADTSTETAAHACTKVVHTPGVFSRRFADCKSSCEGIPALKALGYSHSVRSADAEIDFCSKAIR
jgi:hypothetical protein